MGAFGPFTKYLTTTFGVIPLRSGSMRLARWMCRVHWQFGPTILQQILFCLLRDEERSRSDPFPSTEQARGDHATRDPPACAACPALAFRYSSPGVMASRHASTAVGPFGSWRPTALSTASTN